MNLSEPFHDAEVHIVLDMLQAGSADEYPVVSLQEFRIENDEGLIFPVDIHITFEMVRQGKQPALIS